MTVFRHGSTPRRRRRRTRLRLEWDRTSAAMRRTAAAAEPELEIADEHPRADEPVEERALARRRRDAVGIEIDVEVLGLQHLEVQLLVLNFVAAEILRRGGRSDDHGCSKKT